LLPLADIVAVDSKRMGRRDFGGIIRMDLDRATCDEWQQL